MPAAAAIPFMALRLSILGKNSLSDPVLTNPNEPHAGDPSARLEGDGKILRRQWSNVNVTRVYNDHNHILHALIMIEIDQARFQQPSHSEFPDLPIRAANR